MEFTAAQIAAFLSGTVEGNPEAKVCNVAKIEEGAPGMLSFLANPKYNHYLYETKSSIVLINNDFQLQGEVSATLVAFLMRMLLLPNFSNYTPSLHNQNVEFHLSHLFHRMLSSVKIPTLASSLILGTVQK